MKNPVGCLLCMLFGNNALINICPPLINAHYFAPFNMPSSLKDLVTSCGQAAASGTEK